MLKINEETKTAMGTAKAKDIKEHGLIKASMMMNTTLNHSFFTEIKPRPCQKMKCNKCPYNKTEKCLMNEEQR